MTIGNLRTTLIIYFIVKINNVDYWKVESYSIIYFIVKINNLDYRKVDKYSIFYFIVLMEVIMDQ